MKYVWIGWKSATRKVCLLKGHYEAFRIGAHTSVTKKKEIQRNESNDTSYEKKSAFVIGF